MNAPTFGRSPGLPGFAGRGAALWAALALACALRIALWLHRTGPVWFEEKVPLAWALRLWGFDRGGFDPNPHSALWPHLSVYFFFAVQLLHYWAGRLSGAYAGPADFNAAVTLDPDLLRSSSMIAALLVGVLTVWASARLAERVAGRSAMPWVALVLALDPNFIRHSLVISPDMLLTLFVVLGLVAALEVSEHGTLRASLLGGLWLGLGTACKYSPALLAAPLLVAHALRPGGRRGIAVLRDVQLWLAALVALAAFIAATPYTVIDFVGRWSDVLVATDALMGGSAGGTRQFAALFYLRDLLPADLGWPLFVLLLGGVGGSLVRRTPERMVILAFVLPYAVMFGLVATPFTRYLLPVLPPALALTAGVGRELLTRFSARRWLMAAGLVALLGLTVQSARFMEEYLRPESRAIARDWFVKHVPDRALVAAEHTGPPIPERAARTAALSMSGVSERWRRTGEAGRAYWVMSILLSFPVPEVSATFYDPLSYMDFDYVIVSSGVSGRYLADPARFPVQCDFYQALHRFFDEVYASPVGHSVGPTITVYRPIANRVADLASWWAARMPRHGAPGREAGDDKVARLFAERGQLFMDAERYPAALRGWRRALAWPDAPADWWMQYGLCAVLAGDSLAACEGLGGAYRRDPSLTEAGLLWAGEAYTAGRFEESSGALQDVLARDGLTPAQRERAEHLGTMLARRTRGAR